VPAGEGVTISTGRLYGTVVTRGGRREDSNKSTALIGEGEDTSSNGSGLAEGCRTAFTGFTSYTA
jgi:hypothetical protein